MPGLFAVNQVGGMLAALVTLIPGFVVQGLVFGKAWMAGNGYTEAM